MTPAHQQGDGWDLGQTSLTLWTYELETKVYRPLTNGGGSAIWLNDGRRIIYNPTNRLMSVDVVSGTTGEVLAVPGELLAAPRLLHPDRDLALAHYFERYLSGLRIEDVPLEIQTADGSWTHDRTCPSAGEPR